MPRIPTYDGPQIRQAGLGAPQVGGRGPDNSDLVQGVNQIGRAATQYFAQEKQKADQAAVLDADNQLNQWQLNTMFNNQDGVYTKKGKNALDVTNQTVDSFDKYAQELSAKLKDGDQRTRFNEIAARRKQSLMGDLNRYEYQQRETYYDDVDKSQVETAMQGAALYYDKPDKIAEYNLQMRAVLASQAERKGLPPEALQANLLRFNSQMASNVIQRMASDDPYRAKQYFETAQKDMTAEDQVQIDRLITREIKSRELEARQAQMVSRAELSSKIGDATAAYLQGFDFAEPPSQGEFIASYGAEEGNQRYAQFLKVQNLGSSIRELATAGPEERSAIIDQYNPAKGGVASEGFKGDAQLYVVLLNSVSRLDKELQSDPASYAAKYSPNVQQAAAMLSSGDPRATEAYAAATIAEQVRLGAAKPQLLTDAQAASIASGFTQVQDGGSNAANMIEQLQQQWGKNWPEVYRQLQPKLPGAAVVIGSGVDEQTAALLARIAPLKNEELKKGLDSTAADETRKSLNEAMSSFRLTLAGQVGGERTFATMYNEAERLSYAYMAQGVSATDAAQKAVKSMVDDKYTLKGTWRAPKELDADLIETGSDVELDSLDIGNVQFAMPAGVSEEFARDRVQSALKRDGYWVTLPDESGLALYYSGSAVIDKSGKPIARTWDQLSSKAAERPGYLEQFLEGAKRLRDANDAVRADNARRLQEMNAQ